MIVEERIQAPHYARTAIHKYGQTPENGMHFIFVTEDKFRGDLWKLHAEYFETHKRIAIPGQALLVDLCGKEPGFKSVPMGYTLP